MNIIKSFFILIFLSMYIFSTPLNWTNTICESKYSNSNIVVDNKGYIYVSGACGKTFSRNHSFLIKYNNKGKKIWKRNFNYFNIKRQNKTLIDNNNNIYICSDNLYKYNENGIELWSQTFNVSERTMSFCSLDIDDNIIVLDYNNEEFILVKFNKLGNKISENKIVLPNINYRMLMSSDTNNIYYLINSSILKYNTNGKKVWEHKLPVDNPLELVYMQISQNKLYIAQRKNNKLFLLKKDLNFNDIWTVELDSNILDVNNILADNNEVFISGRTNFKENHSTDAFIIKIGANNKNGFKILGKELGNSIEWVGMALSKNYIYFIDWKEKSSDNRITSLSQISKSYNTTAPNQPPTLTTKSITPNKIKSGENITFTTTWNDPENKSIVDVKVRYRKQGSSNWTTNVMSHKSGYTFEKEKTITGTAGIYEVEFMAKDADTPSGERTNDTGWLDGGSFEIEADTVVIPPVVTPTELPTLSLNQDINFGKSTTRSLNVTNRAKIKLEVKNGTEVQVNFDGIGSYEDSKTITSDGVYEFSYLFKKSDYTSDSSDFWKKDLTFTATAYNSKGASNVVTSGKFTIYDLDEWRAWKDKLEKEKIQADIDSKITEKEKSIETYKDKKGLYSTACEDAYKKITFSNAKKPNDYRRIFNGVKIYNDIGNEKTIEGRGRLPDKSVFKIYVSYGTKTNYPALVEIKYNIKGYPLADGSTRKKRKMVQNYEDKELAKSYLLQSILVQNFDGVCTERNDLKNENIEEDVDVIKIVEDDSDNFDIEADLKNEVLFDTYAELSINNETDSITEYALAMRWSEDKSYKDFLENGDYLTEFQINVIEAHYHYMKWNEDESYNFPNKDFYTTVLQNYEYQQSDKEDNLIIQFLMDFFEIQEAQAGLASASVKTLYKATKRFVKKALKTPNKKFISQKVRMLKFYSKRGLNKHKYWQKNNLFGKGYMHEFKIKIPKSVKLPYKIRKGQKSFYLDAIKFDFKNKKIILRELKPNSKNAIRKGEKQLKNSETVLSELKKGDIPFPKGEKQYPTGFFKNFKIEVKKVDVYE